MAGVQFFPPSGFPHQKPRGQKRQCLMMLPPRPIAHLIVRQTGFAFAALYTLFDAMFGFGHPGKFPQGCLSRRIGEVIIPLHDLVVVAVTVTYHPQRLLITLLTPMGSRHHPPFDGLNYQGAFTAIAHVDLLPRRRIRA